MVNFCAVCGCCTRTDIVREHLEGTLRICDVSAMGLYGEVRLIFIKAVFIMPFVRYLVFYWKQILKLYIKILKFL
jgi:hypothetical protein